MAERVILAVDQSTAGTKAVLFDHGGNILSKVVLTPQTDLSKSGLCEHDPRELGKRQESMQAGG